ncbi:MAG: glycosyltransferase family 2 protein [bacterium]|nr:glycosyltransferase family 2 protein [bacterium]
MAKQKIVVVMPAYNAEKTIAKTVQDIPPGVVDEIIVVDDASHDNTVNMARALGLQVFVHEKNRGYGGNQKTCYQKALAQGADIVVMVHPDYQYDSRLIPYMIKPITDGLYDIMLGSRIRTRSEALAGGMPLYKYISNRALTLVENIFFGQNLSEFHTGFRAYTRKVLETIPWQNNSDNFVFDTEFLAEAVYFGFRLGETPVPARYFKEASSINFLRSTVYGLSTLGVVGKFVLQKLHLGRFEIFKKEK